MAKLTKAVIKEIEDNFFVEVNTTTIETEEELIKMLAEETYVLDTDCDTEVEEGIRHGYIESKLGGMIFYTMKNEKLVKIEI